MAFKISKIFKIFNLENSEIDTDVLFREYIELVLKVNELEKDLDDYERYLSKVEDKYYPRKYSDYHKKVDEDRHIYNITFGARIPKRFK